MDLLEIHPFFRRYLYPCCYDVPDLGLCYTTICLADPECYCVLVYWEVTDMFLDVYVYNVKWSADSSREWADKASY
jgi:hypothetical protein